MRIGGGLCACACARMQFCVVVGESIHSRTTVYMCICSFVRAYAMLDDCVAATDQEGYLSCQNRLRRVRFKIGFTLVYRTYRLVYSLCDIFPLLCLLFQGLVPPNTPGRQRSPPSFCAYGHGTSPEYSCGLDVPCGFRAGAARTLCRLCTDSAQTDYSPSARRSTGPSQAPRPCTTLFSHTCKLPERGTAGVDPPRGVGVGARARSSLFFFRRADWRGGGGMFWT